MTLLEEKKRKLVCIQGKIVISKAGLFFFCSFLEHSLSEKWCYLDHLDTL